MTVGDRRPLLALLTLTAALGAGAAASCSSGPTCNNCPVNVVTVASASPDIDLDITKLTWSGPACPAGQPQCEGSGAGTTCTVISIAGAAPGACNLSLTHSDGQIQTIQTTFGPASTQTCCTGFPATGDTNVVILPKMIPDGGMDDGAAMSDGAATSDGSGASDGSAPETSLN
jgi:hypothetical protein